MSSRWMLISFWLSAVCFAQTRHLASVPTPASEALIYLVDIRTGRLLPSSGSIRPRRVYVVRKDTRAQPYYHLSNRRGEIAEPLERLVEGTVLTGDQLGDVVEKRYLLHANGTWEPTTEGENLLVYRTGNRPSLHLRYPAGKMP